MADYGLKIFDSDGNVTLDVSDKITRLRYSNSVAAGASSSTTLADISGLSSVEISVCTEVDSFPYNKCSHKIERSGTTITWTAQSGTYYNSSGSLIFIFLYT